MVRIARKSTKKKDVTNMSPLPVNSVSIPAEASTVPEVFTEHVIAIYGDSGCGKTSLAAQFPGYVIAQFEPMRKGLALRKVDMSYISQKGYSDTDRRPFIQFCNFVEQCVKDETVKGIGIDTFNLLFQSCQDYICEEKGVVSPNELKDFGQTWSEIQDTVRNILNIFLDSGKGLVFIDHSTQTEVEIGDNVFFRTQPNLRDSKTGSLPIIKEMTDVVVYYGLKSDGSRYMQVSPTQEIYCKSAIDGHFKTPDDEYLLSFDVGNSPAKAYDSLIAAFNNELENTKPKVKKSNRQQP